MNLIFILFVLWVPEVLMEETSPSIVEDVRKIYGMNFQEKCADYYIIFKCMTACKSRAYGSYRLNHKCKCTCLESTTSTLLPYFQWRTTRPTRGLPVTQTPSLYHVAGTLSPPPTTVYTTIYIPPVTCPRWGEYGTGTGGTGGTGDGNEAVTGGGDAADGAKGDGAAAGGDKAAGGDAAAGGGAPGGDAAAAATTVAAPPA